MDVKTTAKILCLYESGVVTATEVANKLLYELVSEPEIDMIYISSMGLLPNEIRLALFRLLRSIKDADYQWVPFLLGVRTQPPDPDEYSNKLRQISAIFR